MKNISESYIGPPDNTYVSEGWLSQEVNSFSFLNKLRVLKKNVGEKVKAYIQLKEKGSLWLSHMFTKIGTIQGRCACPLRQQDTRIC